MIRNLSTVLFICFLIITFVSSCNEAPPQVNDVSEKADAQAIREHLNKLDTTPKTAYVAGRGADHVPVWSQPGAKNNPESLLVRDLDVSKPLKVIIKEEQTTPTGSTYFFVQLESETSFQGWVAQTYLFRDEYGVVYYRPNSEVAERFWIQGPHSVPVALENAYGKQPPKGSCLHHKGPMTLEVLEKGKFEISEAFTKRKSDYLKKFNWHRNIYLYVMKGQLQYDADSEMASVSLGYSPYDLEKDSGVVTNSFEDLCVEELGYERFKRFHDEYGNSRYLSGVESETKYYLKKASPLIDAAETSAIVVSLPPLPIGHITVEKAREMDNATLYSFLGYWVSEYLGNSRAVHSPYSVSDSENHVTEYKARIAYHMIFNASSGEMVKIYLDSEYQSDSLTRDIKSQLLQLGYEVGVADNSHTDLLDDAIKDAIAHGKLDTGDEVNATMLAKLFVANYL